MSANPRRCLTIVLAAGEGVRMRSARPKVLHELAGRSMLAHTLSAVLEGAAGDVVVVVGPDRDSVAAEALKVAPGAKIVVQLERQGTADAVLAARGQIAQGYDDILVTYADIPLIKPATLAALGAELAQGADVVALGFEAADPAGYGRLIERGGRLMAIREHKDASAEERASRLCNAGPLAFSGAQALKLLNAVTPNNAQREYYLTDIVEIASARGLVARALIADEKEVMGINDRGQLAAAEAALQDRLRRRAMAEGATLIAPETVFLAFDVRMGRDVLIEPHVVIGPGVRIEDGALIRAFSHLEGARVARGASVGPFARLRPGADIAANARIGNFVEIKQAMIEGRRQDQSSDLYRRCASRGERQHRRGNHHLQLRRLRQAQDRHRRRRLHRLELGPRRPGHDRRRRLYRLGLGHHRIGRGGRACGGARPSGDESRLGEGVPGQAQEGLRRRAGRYPIRFPKPTPNLAKSNQIRPSRVKIYPRKAFDFLVHFEPFQGVALTPRAFFFTGHSWPIGRS